MCDLTILIWNFILNFYCSRRHLYSLYHDASLFRSTCEVPHLLRCLTEICSASRRPFRDVSVELSIKTSDEKNAKDKKMRRNLMKSTRFKSFGSLESSSEVFGCTIFSPVHLREYAVVIGSLVATITELYEPFGINDNAGRPGNWIYI